MNKTIAFFSLTLIVTSPIHCGWSKFLRETKRVMRQTGHGLGKGSRFIENKVLEPSAHFLENKVLEPSARTVENEILEPVANGINDHVIKPACKGFKKGAHKEAEKQGEKAGETAVKVVIKVSADYLQTKCNKRTASEALSTEPSYKRQRTK